MADMIELWQGGPTFCQAEHFKIGTDSVLLADFVNTNGAKRGIDLGGASGILGLLLLVKSEKLAMTELEILPEACELARENMERNGMSDRCEVVCGDIRAHRELFRTGSFDLVVSNPPYFAPGSGKLSPDAARAAARLEVTCTLDELCTAAAFLLRTGGTFALVHKPERLSEVLCTMTAHGIEPKRLRFACHESGAKPNLVLIEGRRGGHPGMTVEADLILHDPDGSETDEVKRIYRR